jgi:hypothetical protein
MTDQEQGHPILDSLLAQVEAVLTQAVEAVKSNPKVQAVVDALQAAKQSLEQAEAEQSADPTAEPPEPPDDASQ